MLAFDLSMSHVAALPEHAVWLVVLHGRLARLAHAAHAADALRGAASWAPRTTSASNIFHDLGKLCFAFTAFWGYLTFGQYLVMWYGNLGEETHWPRLRLIEPWVRMTVSAVLMVFFLPFFGLLSKAAKMYRPTLALFTVISLVGMFLVRYLEVYPSLYGVIGSNPFGLWEVLLFLAFAGTWGLCYLAFMNAFPRMRVFMLTSPYRDEVQVPVDAETMEPLPAHE